MRFLYLIYGLIVLLGVTLYNLDATDGGGWSSNTGGRGAWTASGGHK